MNVDCNKSGFEYMDPFGKTAINDQRKKKKKILMLNSKKAQRKSPSPHPMKKLRTDDKNPLKQSLNFQEGKNFSF